MESDEQEAHSQKPNVLHEVGTRTADDKLIKKQSKASTNPTIEKERVKVQLDLEKIVFPDDFKEKMKLLKSIR